MKCCTGGRPCANRAGHRLSWSSQTGMGRVDWRICIRCIKLRLIEPCRLPGMIRSCGDTDSRTRQLTRPGSSVASDKHLKSSDASRERWQRCSSQSDGGGDSSQVYLTVVLREHPRTPANGAVIAGAKGRLAKVAKCCVHVHLPLFAVQRRSRCSAARGTSPRYLRLGQLLRVRAPFGEQRWAASRSAGV